ncbi:MAG: hypothetical protein ACP5TV_10905, partial [Anaerolineae bacterium]
SLTTPFPGTRLWEELVARNPETQYNSDFSRAYYYNSYTEEIAPFLNVSEVSDQRLSQLAIEARRRFDESRRKRKYQRRLGKPLGTALWTLSRLRPVRAVGRRILDLPAVSRWIPLREEQSPKWS